MTDWNSALYMKFENERTRAARDLVAQIPAFYPGSIFDLGCGPGNGTELLAAAFSSATIVGLDLSDNMLAVARTRSHHRSIRQAGYRILASSREGGPHLRQCGIDFVPNHHEFMVRLVSFLHEGGRLAVQMPNNIQELSHALMRMVAADGPWAKRLVPMTRSQLSRSRGSPMSPNKQAGPHQRPAIIRPLG